MLFSRKLLSIGTDRSLFTPGSAVRKRQIAYAKDWEEVHIVVFCGKGFTEQPIAPNCWAYPTSSASKWLYPFDAIRLGRFISTRRKITNITCQDPFLTAMAGVSLKKEFKARGQEISLEIQVHTDIGSPYFGYSFGNKIRKFMAKIYLHKSDRIRVVSDRIRDYITNDLGINAAKIETRPVAVDIEAIKSAPITVDLHKKYPQFSRIALMASRLEKEKDIKLAIHSWLEVIKKLPQTGLIIVGSGSEEERLKRLVRRLSLSGRVVFESWADKGILASYYKTADVFLNTSIYEGYGMTLVEANAAGCKVVSTDVGVAKELEGVHVIPVKGERRLTGEILALLR